MIILETEVDNHYIAIDSHGFIGIHKGVMNNYPASIRLILNFTNSLEGTNGMNRFADGFRECLAGKIDFSLLVGQSLRGICERFEYQDVHSFYDQLSEEDQIKFINHFGELSQFEKGPIFAFVNSKGVEYEK